MFGTKWVTRWATFQLGFRYSQHLSALEDSFVSSSFAASYRECSSLLALSFHKSQITNHNSSTKSSRNWYNKLVLRHVLCSRQFPWVALESFSVNVFLCRLPHSFEQYRNRVLGYEEQLHPQCFDQCWAKSL